jgi:glycosyltransferase involved in cell wall biosynthesis
LRHSSSKSRGEFALPSLRIAIDASRTTVSPITGTEHYALELIRALIEVNTEHELILYFRDPPRDGLFPNLNHVTIKVLPFKRMWSHIRLAWEVSRTRPDVLFVPSHTLPFLFLGQGVVTLHDVGYKHFPQAHKPFQRFYLDLTTRFSAWRASRVIADSQATADDLHHFYGTSHNKMQVIYLGLSPLAPAASDGLMPPERFFVFVGTLQPRKNIEGIVKAYQIYRAKSANPAEFVLAGGKGWLFDENWIAGADGVHLTGYISDEQKTMLYQKALALVFPSFYEGFGFPALEAMSLGTPVIASNTSSLPEVVGDAGILVDPNDPEQIADAMLRIEQDPELTQRLFEAGKVQAQKFQWHETARQVLNLFEQLP